MSAILAKLFTGSSSSSHSIPDVTSMESLCKAINDLTTESAEFVGQKAAEITRKNKEMFEKKTNDIEAFLLHCSPSVGSAAMMAAIKAMFDTSLAKNYEAGTDRAVELLKHYLDGGQLVATHLKHVPEIIFPLVRNISFYCLEKRNKPEIGEEIVLTALSQLFPNMVEGSMAAVKYVTSWHSALFACVLKTKHYHISEQYLSEFVDAIYNEKSFQGSEEIEDINLQQNVTENVLKQSNSKLNDVGTTGKTGVVKGYTKQVANQIQSLSLPPFINPKYVFQYLYYGALILIELKKYRRAMILLETCVSAPTYQPHDIQIEAYKKFILVSLFVQGYASDVPDRYPSINRASKAKMIEYRNLLGIRFKRGKNTHGEIETYMNANREKFEKDGNWELMEKICKELRKKAIIAIAHIYSTISISDIKQLANLTSDEETMFTIEELVNEGRLVVQFDKINNCVIWHENIPPVNAADVAAANRLVDTLNLMLEEKNKSLKTSASSGRNQKSSVMFHEDEGLSMGMSPLET